MSVPTAQHKFRSLFLLSDVTPPQISVVGGKTQYEIEVHLDFEYPKITASDSSGETPGITRLDHFDKSKRGRTAALNCQGNNSTSAAR